MRRHVAILLSFVLLLVLARPVMPHLLFQLNRGQIQSSLCEQRDNVRNCCKGSCFLRKQLRQADPAQSQGIATLATSVGLEQWMPVSLEFELEGNLVHLQPALPGDEALIDESYTELPTPPPWKPLLA